MSFIQDNIVASLLVYVFAWSKQKIEKKEGIIMLAIYIVYMVYACVRGLGLMA